jgi:FMN phosphatase YigB (HAD superfamily)
MATLTFDVFGTLLDYRESSSNRMGMKYYMEYVASFHHGNVPYKRVRDLFLEAGYDWRGLKVRDGVVEAMTRLAKKFELAPLSNGDSELMREMGEYFHLPWDRFFRVEEVHHYKPDAGMYMYAFQDLGLLLPFSSVIHVASHPFDLRAAKKCGFGTAYIHWEGYAEPMLEQEFTYQEPTLSSLADRLLG